MFFQSAGIGGKFVSRVPSSQLWPTLAVRHRINPTHITCTGAHGDALGSQCFGSMALVFILSGVANTIVCGLGSHTDHSSSVAHDLAHFKLIWVSNHDFVMPVTITPSSHKARAFGYTAGLATDAKTLLDRALQTSIPEDVIIHQSTWGHGAAALPGSIISSANGFVDTLMHAYGQHHHLVLRPEDLWFAILTQFALYVNANGEELRSHFVAHEGKKILRLEYMPFDIRTFDFRVFANQMGQLLGDVVVDATLREWIMPDFSTTDDNDRVVAAIVMMGTLQTYFIYSCGIICGFPTVELLGEKADYEAILGRLDKLEEYGAEPSQFAALLRPVLRRFVRSFEAPEAEDVVKFWRTAFDLDDSVCGITTYTGWITAFTFWDAVRGWFRFLT